MQHGSDERSSAGSEREIGDGVERSGPRCDHNDWDNVRVKKGTIMLRCRTCKDQWKTGNKGLLKCSAFYSGGCKLGNRCSFIHIHRYKNEAKEQEHLLKVAAARSGNKRSKAKKALLAAASSTASGLAEPGCGSSQADPFAERAASSPTAGGKPASEPRSSEASSGVQSPASLLPPQLDLAQLQAAGIRLVQLADGTFAPVQDTQDISQSLSDQLKKQMFYPTFATQGLQAGDLGAQNPFAMAAQNAAQGVLSPVMYQHLLPMAFPAYHQANQQQQQQQQQPLFVVAQNPLATLQTPTLPNTAPAASSLLLPTMTPQFMPLRPQTPSSLAPASGARPAPPVLPQRSPSSSLSSSSGHETPRLAAAGGGKAADRVPAGGGNGSAAGLAANAASPGDGGPPPLLASAERSASRSRAARAQSSPGGSLDRSEGTDKDEGAPADRPWSSNQPVPPQGQGEAWPSEAPSKGNGAAMAAAWPTPPGAPWAPAAPGQRGSKQGAPKPSVWTPADLERSQYPSSGKNQWPSLPRLSENPTQPSNTRRGDSVSPTPQQPAADDDELSLSDLAKLTLQITLL
ncbi:hypothetical protein DIPPA_29200 [Diplonema papillatum]|nr:hypothetical protein DIPPA_29200 [Diplonema papillatum]